MIISPFLYYFSVKQPNTSGILFSGSQLISSKEQIKSKLLKVSYLISSKIDIELFKPTSMDFKPQSFGMSFAAT